MTASLKKVVKQRDHKERGQLASRAKYGLLEKHKDYVLRAKDYNSKKRRLNALQKRARDRNPDEFYFKMNSAKTVDGVHHLSRTQEATNGGLGGKAMKLLRTQDQNYINMLHQVNRKKIDKLESELLVMQSASRPSSHVLFVDSNDEAGKFDAAAHFQTLPLLVNNVHNRQTVANLTKMAKIQPEPPVLDKSVKKEKLKRYRELAERLEREGGLLQRKRQAELQKVLLGKGQRKKVGEDSEGVPIYKWRAERAK